ncbi:MAG: acetyl-CoA carboxylase biotin carboxylase subunit [Candidatus Hydrogenedentes bacterium]|nr:acetyl-CoA carboxylase biotin carboxylase subunit [Candidatus Hydrogenedentota bacterium]
MFRRVLIANRGEIAVRVIRACREMGINTIAVYSTADQECLHASLADESICIGPPPPQESYLLIPSIIAAAEICDAQAIHPGYGFLSENAKFAGICRDCNIQFIGPSPEAIAMSGDKAACRQKVRAAGVPVVPGSDTIIKDAQEALQVAKTIGFPLLVKAAAGGGGKGMRLAHNDVALKNALSLASAEAQAAFGDGGVYLEKFVEHARHVEFQILADHHGRVLTLGERECSIQRRHQKLIEETPSMALNSSLRHKMSKAAIRAARAIGYSNAGTAEFLLASDGQFYFIEFNARIQVEHPVTEAVTGLDLVKEQIRIASGEPLGYSSVTPTGCAIEARIYAEDPEANFAPCPGVVGRCHLPGGPGLRVDTHLFSGYTVPRYYDSLLAKVIAWGRDRNEAINRLAGALDEVATEGVKSTARLCARIIRGDRFRRGDLGPDLIGEYVPKAKPDSVRP